MKKVLNATKKIPLLRFFVFNQNFVTLHGKIVKNSRFF